MNKYLKLGKFTISIPVALTGFLGYFMINPSFDLHAFYTIAGIFLLSSSSAALNQIQERRTDALMPRTAQRPLPSGQITLAGAILFSVLCAITGSVLLLLTGYPLAAAIGIFTLCWYNLVYTPLKRVTAFAVLPGALIGALPPLIGWTAAGGNPLDMEILAVAFLLFVGQMPHYWLLLIKIGDEFHQAGMPVITSLFDQRQIRNLSFVWIAATGVCVLMLPATPIIRHRAMSLLLIAAAILFLIRMFLLSYRGNLVEHWKKAFITVNLFYLMIILVIIADRLF
ncbi:MAG: protoheme IX farnesyltransferase [Bacteroidales bacterium]|nr:protoheme IX farnesyltransferase [Bacteroidales bacterium]